MAESDVAGVVEERGQLPCALIDLGIRERYAGPLADRSRQELLDLRVEVDLAGRRPVRDGSPPLPGHDLGECFDPVRVVDLEEHRLAVSVVLPIEALYSALAEEGLLQWRRGGAGALEPCRVVEDAGGFGAGHAGGTAQQQPGLEDVVAELGGPAGHETVGLA